MTGPIIAAIVGSATVLSGFCCLGINSCYRSYRTINFTNTLATRCLDENKEFSAEHGHWSSSYQIGASPTSAPAPQAMASDAMTAAPTSAPAPQAMASDAMTAAQSPFEPFTLIPIDFLLEGAKLMGAGAAIIALAGAAIGIGNVFSSLIHSVARNPSLAKQLFGYAILGFALTEAIALFALMMAFLILFVF